MLLFAKRLRLCLALVAGSPLAFSQTPIPRYTYQIVHKYPHDPAAFTEGLFFLNGFLYEGTGLRGQSVIRRVRLETGRVVQEQALPDPYFGEGIVAWKHRLIQLTYITETGFVYDLNTFKQLLTFHYPGQGWSLTQDGTRIIMDDGTAELRFLNPETLAETGRLSVSANGVPVENLNELEWVNGEIYANVWHTDRIARINPTSGHVIGWIDLTGLLPPSDQLPEQSEQVLNGIAYDQKRNRLFVTGKYWPHLFEIKIKPKR